MDIVGRESPVDLGLGLIALTLSRRDRPLPLFFRSDTAVQGLTPQHVIVRVKHEGEPDA